MTAGPEGIEAIVAGMKARRQVADDYAQFVATQPIDTFPGSGVRVYNVGDPVPASNVALHGYDKAGVVARIKDPDPDVDPAVREEPDDDALAVNDSAAAWQELGFTSTTRYTAPKKGDPIEEWYRYGLARGLHESEMVGLAKADLISQLTYDHPAAAAKKAAPAKTEG